MKHQEHILAVPACCFAANSTGFGIETAALTNEHLVIMQRKGLETNPLYRQLISYSVVRCNGKVLAYRRTPKGNEARLHGQVSIGFGGHVDLEDVAFTNGVIDINETAKNVTQREISEEVYLGEIAGISLLDQFIISNENDTDRVHAGMLSVVDCVQEKAYNAEDQVKLLGWFTPEDLLREFGGEIESWSLGLLNNMGVLGSPVVTVKSSFRGEGQSHSFSR